MIRKKINRKNGMCFIKKLCVMGGFLWCCMPARIWAKEEKSNPVTEVTNTFSTLLNIATALVSSVGALVLLWGFFEWGISMQSQDGTLQASAFKRIGGGLVMVIAPQLLKAFI